jgi:hypothetical protein
MLPDQGCYEERYRVTGAAIRSLAIGLIPLIPVVLSSHPVLWLLLIPILGALAAVPPLLAVATHKIAFRADMAGITLGSDPLRWPRAQADVYIPWSDVAGIVIYRRGGPSGVGQSGPWIGIQRRAGQNPSIEGPGQIDRPTHLP